MYGNDTGRNADFVLSSTVLESELRAWLHATSDGSSGAMERSASFFSLSPFVEPRASDQISPLDFDTLRALHLRGKWMKNAKEEKKMQSWFRVEEAAPALEGNH